MELALTTLFHLLPQENMTRLETSAIALQILTIVTIIAYTFGLVYFLFYKVHSQVLPQQAAEVSQRACA